MGALVALSLGCGPASVEPSSAPVEVSIPGDAVVVGSVAARPPAAPKEAPAITWHADLEGALAESRATGRPLLLFFHATWSASSVLVQRQVWPDPRVRRALLELIPVRIDVTDVDDQEREELAARFGVDRVPAVLVLDATGAERARRSGVITADGLLEIVAGP